VAAIAVEEERTKTSEDAISEKEAVAADLVVAAALELAANSEAVATEVAPAAATGEAAATEAAAALVETLVEPGKPTNTQKTSDRDRFCTIQSPGATNRDLLVLVHCARDILNVMCLIR
jgi:hypothetical protein